MKVGLYLRDYKMTDGGASVLIRTLKQELADMDSDRYEFVTIYNGSVRDPYKKVVDGHTYINLTRMRLKYIIPSKFAELVNVPRRVLSWFICRKGCGQTASIWDRMCKKEGIQILWFTHPLQERTSVPYIFTIWDLGHRMLPAFPEMTGDIADWKDRENIYREMIYRAARVITANEQGKKEILENYSIPEDKIKIVPFPLSDICDSEESAPDISLPENFFLYPAQFWPHKNHIRIVQALTILKEKYDINVSVVFTGADNGSYGYICDEVKKRGLESNVVFTGLVSTPELKYLYTHSRGMIYASLLGPNNMPPYEAVYFNKPVIVSGTAGHREQMGDAALYFDPYDADELAGCINTLLNDKERVVKLEEAADKLREEIISYNYSSRMVSVLDELYEMRICWA